MERGHDRRSSSSGALRARCSARIERLTFDFASMFTFERDNRCSTSALTGSAPCISLALVRSAPRPEMPQLNLHDQGQSRLRAPADHTANRRSSALAVAAMMLLLAVCGWIVGGTERVHWTLIGGPPRPNGPAIADAATMYRWFGASLLRPAELPGLFNILVDVCRRARLSRLPDIYCLPAPGDMNAYALGGPEGAAIVLTEGLLRGMTSGEIAGIFGP
jgi:hypothetical protein